MRRDGEAENIYMLPMWNFWGVVGCARSTRAERVVAPVVSEAVTRVRFEKRRYDIERHSRCMEPIPKKIRTAHRIISGQ